MLFIKLLTLALGIGFILLLYWVVNKKRDEEDAPVDDEIIDDIPVIDPPIDPPQNEVRQYWYKIWRLAQSRPPLEYMKRSLSEKELDYYINHKSEFTLGSPVKFDALGRKK